MLNYDKYKNELKYPARPKQPLWNTTKAQDEAMDLYREQRAAYDKREQELVTQFKQDLMVELGASQLPKWQQNALFRMAWERGHASGYAQVADEASELVDLIIQNPNVATD